MLVNDFIRQIYAPIAEELVSRVELSESDVQAIETALVQGIERGLRRGYFEAHGESDAWWVAFVEEKFGERVELNYEPDVKTENPDVWAQRYGG